MRMRGSPILNEFLSAGGQHEALNVVTYVINENARCKLLRAERGRPKAAAFPPDAAPSNFPSDGQETKWPDEEERRSVTSAKENGDARKGNFRLCQRCPKVGSDARNVGESDAVGVLGQKAHLAQKFHDHVVRAVDGVGKTLKYAHGCRRNSRPVGVGAMRSHMAEPVLLLKVK